MTIADTFYTSGPLGVAATSRSCPIDATIPVGATVLVLASGGSSSGVASAQSAVDSKGNSYNLAYAPNTVGGVTLFAFLATLTTALVSGDTITVTWDNARTELSIVAVRLSGVTGITAGGRIAHSTNDGDTTTLTEPPVAVPCFAIAAVATNAHQDWAAGGSFTDGTTSWTKADTGASTKIGVAFAAIPSGQASVTFAGTLPASSLGKDVGLLYFRTAETPAPQPSTKPRRHPVTGEALPARPTTIHEDVWRFARPWMRQDAIAAGVPAADIIAPGWLTLTADTKTLIGTAGDQGYVRLQTPSSTVAGNRATLATTDTFKVDGNDSCAFGIALDGIHFRRTDAASITDVRVGISFANDAGTTGFTISQGGSDTYATLTIHGGGGSISLGDGGVNVRDGVDMRITRPGLLGVFYDPRESMVTILRGDQVLWRQPVVGIVRTSPLRASVWVEAMSSSRVEMRLKRITARLES